MVYVCGYFGGGYAVYEFMYVCWWVVRFRYSVIVFGGVLTQFLPGNIYIHAIHICIGSYETKSKHMMHSNLLAMPYTVSPIYVPLAFCSIFFKVLSRFDTTLYPAGHPLCNPGRAVWPQHRVQPDIRDHASRQCV